MDNLLALITLTDLELLIYKYWWKFHLLEYFSVTLFLFGIHKRVMAPSIIASRTRIVLSDFNMSCDETGKLILKPRPTVTWPNNIWDSFVLTTNPICPDLQKSGWRTFLYKHVNNVEVLDLFVFVYRLLSVLRNFSRKFTLTIKTWHLFVF